MKFPCAVIIAFLILTVVSHPRADEGSVGNDESPGFREFDDGLLIRGGVGTGNQTISFGVQDADLSHHEITVAPNTSLYVMLGLQYRRIGASAKLRLANTVGDVEETGETTMVDVQLRYFANRFELDAIYRLQSGMHVDNARRFDEEFSSLKLPDFGMQSAALNFFWATNPNYSLKAAYRFTAQHNRSVASLVWIGSLSGLWFRGPGGPARALAEAQGSAAQEDVFFIAQTAAAGVGGAALLQWRGWFVAPLLGATLGAQYLRYETVDSRGTTFVPAPQLNARLSIGRNRASGFGAFVAAVDLRTVPIPGIESGYTTYLFEIEFGKRF